MNIQQRMAELKQLRLERENELYVAVQNGDIATIDALLNLTAKCFVDIKTENAYFLALQCGPIAVQNHLLAKINPDNALAAAALNKNIAGMRHLYPHASTEAVRLALKISVEDGFLGGVQYLLPMVEWDLTDTSLLHSVATGRHPEVFEMVFQMYPLPIAQGLLDDLDASGKFDFQGLDFLRNRIQDEIANENLRATLTTIADSAQCKMGRKI